MGNIKDCPFPKEPCNLKAKNSFRYNGLVHKKVVGIDMEDGKVTLTTKNTKGQNKPAKMMTKSQLSGNDRKVLQTVSKTLRKNRYRKDLKMAAVRRAAALLKAQKVSKK